MKSSTYVWNFFFFKFQVSDPSTLGSRVEVPDCLWDPFTDSILHTSSGFTVLKTEETGIKKMWRISRKNPPGCLCQKPLDLNPLPPLIMALLWENLIFLSNFEMGINDTRKRGGISWLRYATVHIFQNHSQSSKLDFFYSFFKFNSF